MSAEKIDRLLEVQLLLSVMKSDKEFNSDTNSCKTCGSQLLPSGVIAHDQTCKWFAWNSLFSERDNIKNDLGFDPFK